MDKDVLEGLRLFGLSDYESKAYAALVSLGEGTVTEVAQLCDVPRANLYSVLEKLSEKGFADIQKGRPLIFRAREPEKALAEKKEEIAGALGKASEGVSRKLSEAKQKGSAAMPALIWTISGPDAVSAKIRDMLRRARSDVMINTPDLSVLGGQLLQEIRNASLRRVKVRIVSESPPEGVDAPVLVRIRPKIYGTDIVADEREVLIAPSVPLVAAWVDNSDIALHVKDFLSLVWKDAEVLK